MDFIQFESDCLGRINCSFFMSADKVQHILNQPVTGHLMKTCSSFFVCFGVIATHHVPVLPSINAFIFKLPSSREATLLGLGNKNSRSRVEN